jgi:hypothetical protein
METIDIFNEDNSCKIRSAFIEAKGWIFSIYDFINLVCERELRDEYARRCFECKSDNLMSDFFEYKFPGQGQRLTPVTDIRGLQQILMLLPGETGKKYRNIAESTVTRVLAGDQTLIPIIEANAESTDLIHETARLALEKNPIKNQEEVDNFLRGKIDKLKIKNIELKTEIKEIRIALKEKDSLINKSLESLNSLSITNASLSQRNETLSNRNTILINNYAVEPDNEFVEYLIILRKKQDDFIYDSREKEPNESRDSYISSTYKHYVIRCQYRSIEIQINKFKSNYNLSNPYTIYHARNPNPGSLTCVLRTQDDIINHHIGNELKVIDETRLIQYLNNYNNNL